jgi:adenosine kinase
VEAFIVTRGGAGSTVYTAGDKLDIPAVKPRQIVDPTGCGDAYRAGLLFGITEGMSWEDTGRLASLIGSIKIADRGTQNHIFTRASLEQDFKAAFDYAISL